MHPDRSIQENHCGLFLPFPSISESKTYLWQKSFFCKAVDFFLILSSRRSDHINDIEPVHRLSFSFQRFTTIVSKSRPSFPAFGDSLSCRYLHDDYVNDAEDDPPCFSRLQPDAHRPAIHPCHSSRFALMNTNHSLQKKDPLRIFQTFSSTYMCRLMMELMSSAASCGSSLHTMYL